MYMSAQLVRPAYPDSHRPLNLGHPLLVPSPCPVVPSHRGDDDNDDNATCATTTPTTMRRNAHHADDGNTMRAAMTTTTGRRWHLCLCHQRRRRRRHNDGTTVPVPPDATMTMMVRSTAPLCPLSTPPEATMRTRHDMRCHLSKLRQLRTDVVPQTTCLSFHG